MGYFSNKATGKTKEILNKSKSSGGLMGSSSSSSTKKTSGSSSSGSSNKPSPSSSNKSNSTKGLVADSILDFLPSKNSNSVSSNTKSNSNTTYSPYPGGGYTIGSNYGKQVAQAMGIGQSWTASDGSLWTKQNDGTISVKHNGQTYNNAWSPSDLGIAGLQQVAANVPYSYVQDTMNSRLNKALNTEGLEQYAYDDTYWKMYNYIQNLKNSETEAKIRAEYEQLLAQLEQGKPEEYQSKYDPQIDALLNKILNREDFSYDVMNDPLYQQYAQMYQREGDRAMRETLAEAASSAGGMNSYAITAASQANNYYNSQLNDKIPELYQLAYNMYLNDKESQVQDLGILQNMDATQYGRYRDTMNDYYNDKTFAYGAYNDAVQQGNWQKTFDYNSNWDNINFMNNNYLTNREWNANQSDKELENTRYDESTAKEEVWKYISLGVMPSADLIAKAGMTDTDVRLAVEAVKAENAKKSSGKSSSKNNDDEDYEGDDDNDYSDDDDNGGTVDDKASIYQSVYAGASELKNNGNKQGAKNYIQEAVTNGYITQTEANVMKMTLFLW